MAGPVLGFKCVTVVFTEVSIVLIMSWSQWNS
jgi:hypothetical protein